MGWTITRVRYPNRPRDEVIGYLYSEHPELLWQLQESADSWHRPSNFSSTIFLLSYPGSNHLLGTGTPRCLGPQGQTWNWVQVVQAPQYNGWWFGNCYALEEFVRWIRGANLPPRTYDLKGSALI